MPVSISRTCSRCRRDIAIPCDSVAAATEAETRFNKAAETSKAIEDFVKGLMDKDAPLPDLVVIQRTADGVELIVHDFLCPAKAEGRSCAERANDLVQQLKQLEERKPRTRKAKATEEKPAAEVAETK